MSEDTPKDYSIEALEKTFSSTPGNFSDLPEEEVMRLVHKELKKSRKKEHNLEISNAQI